MSEIRVDTISEKTSANGVAIDSVTLKDGGIAATAASTITTADNTAQLTLTSTDTDANSGPRLDFIRNPGEAGADADFLSAILHRGYNDATELTTFAEINAQIVDASNGSEDGRFYINTMVAGTAATSRMELTPTETVFNEGSADLDFRVESNGDANCFVVDAGNDNVNIRAGGANLGGVFNVLGTAVISIDDNSDTLTLISTDADANAGPNLKLYRNSSSPADNDTLGLINFVGRNDNSQDVEYAKIRAFATDVSDGSEDVLLAVVAKKDGTDRDYLKIGGSEIVFNEDSQAISFRVESDSSTKAFFVNNNYAVAHITATGSATKESYYSGGLGMLQLGVGGGIFSYDYNVVDGPYMLNNHYIDNGTQKYVGTGQAAKLGMYTGILLFHNASSGSADGTVSFNERFRIAQNGDITATDTSIGSNSDERLKENITDFTYDVAKFKQFKPKTFDWKNPEIHSGVSGNRGFIAQEIETVDDYYINKEELILPETEETGNADYNLIPEDEDGKRISYTSKLGKKDAMYISVIQQLITKIETLETKVAALEG